MAKKLTVRLRDAPHDSCVEVDGERVHGVASVQTSYTEGSMGGMVTLTLVDADFVDERSRLRGSV